MSRGMGARLDGQPRVGLRCVKGIGHGAWGKERSEVRSQRSAASAKAAARQGGQRTLDTSTR